MLATLTPLLRQVVVFYDLGPKLCLYGWYHNRNNHADDGLDDFGSSFNRFLLGQIPINWHKVFLQNDPAPQQNGGKGIENKQSDIVV